MDAYAVFAASRRTAPPGARVRAVDPHAPVTISIYLKPRTPPQTAATRGGLADQRAEEHADDVRRISAFAAAAGLAVIEVAPARRLIRLAGSADRAQAAFRTALSIYQDGGVQFQAREGTLQLPRDLHDIVAAVLGLDQRPAARPHHVRASAQAAGYRPDQVGELYDFPATLTGAGECIALIELGGGFRRADTVAAFKAMGRPAPHVVAVPVDGGHDRPTPDDGADAEVALDIQVSGGIAPGAAIAVYFAPNTDAGFADAISAAVHDATHKPSVISISWGSAEPDWTAQAVSAMNGALQDAGALGVSVFVAAGDSLATDGVSDGKVHVDFPASSPYAIGCGGTRLDGSGATILSEAVWNDGTSGTGGGISTLFAVPGFQSAMALPRELSTGQAGRGVPDVAGNAAPETGYRIVVNGRTGVVGGTSAVAPLWAGLVALANQHAGRPAGFFLPTLYGAAAGAVREITSGDNKPAGTALGYPSGKGWNACTGLGVPDGAKVAALLAAAKLS